MAFDILEKQMVRLPRGGKHSTDFVVCLTVKVKKTLYANFGTSSFDVDTSLQ